MQANRADADLSHLIPEGADIQTVDTSAMQTMWDPIAYRARAEREKKADVRAAVVCVCVCVCLCARAWLVVGGKAAVFSGARNTWYTGANATPRTAVHVSRSKLRSSATTRRRSAWKRCTNKQRCTTASIKSTPWRPEYVPLVVAVAVCLAQVASLCTAGGTCNAQAAAMELELAEKRSRGMKTKAQTWGKYGW